MVCLVLVGLQDVDLRESGEPKKGGKRLADLGDGQEGVTKDEIVPKENSSSNTDEQEKQDENVPTQGNESGPEPEAVEIEVKSKPPQQEQAEKEVAAKIEASDATATDKSAQQLQRVVLSSRQRNASQAWERYNKEVEKHFGSLFKGVDNDMKSVAKNLQDNLQSAKGVERNVKTAKTYLTHISQALESIDTLVVPIVLQKNGNF
ncbi:hypothetical protein GUITHDRAFT_137458 [Guillardia theta CCMP2712]|uniref:Biogenesis of lysosome-related organelles complex 1 subunit 3 n=1 Tax=Guillardia theta (strain CCMP2712) TaxID=905079 RepID=L1JG09_GUITC|nr:hypothetical protein GUITHDRAFT_137458 [Guillardia theta CCMP2712]EKX47257.1 hypothetical protein GUITHDRAFT_137458 [Guillardia theta CCMP2712]|eukprot:XP_005834237.1 hypothetical protein GUITHDRAFT_137458 [Guillardia theta CCMP2712]